MIPVFAPSAGQIIVVVLVLLTVLGIAAGSVAFAVTRSGRRSFGVAAAVVVVALLIGGGKVAWESLVSPRARQQARVVADRDAMIDAMGLDPASWRGETRSDSCDGSDTSAISIGAVSAPRSALERDAILRDARRWLLERGGQPTTITADFSHTEPTTDAVVSGWHGRRWIEIRDPGDEGYVMIEVREDCPS